jgi:hypothetical protein
MTEEKKVLLIGIDPKLIDFSKSTTAGCDVDRIHTAGQDAKKGLWN